MGPEFQEMIEQRERRVSVLRELISALQLAQRAFVLTDLKGIQLHTKRQHQLCEDLLLLGSGPSSAPRNASPADLRRWNRLSEEIAEFEGRVRHLTRVQNSLLARSRRAMDIFARLLASTALTYTPPPAARAAGAGR
jgi:hypothetical protein